MMHASMCCEIFSFMMSYPAMSLGDRFCMSRKGGTGEGGWMQGANSMGVSGLGCERPLRWLELGRSFLLL